MVSMNWFESIILSVIEVWFIFAICLVILYILWLFFSPRKDILSQAFAELPKEWQDHVKDNYQQVIVGKKTIDELTDEMLAVETEENK